MSSTLRLRACADSWVSDWNNGSTNFLRGWARESLADGAQR